jgi:hypothetical protein
MNNYATTIENNRTQRKKDKDMKQIIFTETELIAIREHGETCPAVARQAMERSKLSFDDIEQINDHYEVHTWGSNTDRKYRKAAINKAIQKVAANPLDYCN